MTMEDLETYYNAKPIDVDEVPHLTESQIKDARNIITNMFNELKRIGVKLDYDYEGGDFFIHSALLVPLDSYINEISNVDVRTRSFRHNIHPLTIEAYDCIKEEGKIIDSSHNTPYWYCHTDNDMNYAMGMKR